MKKRLTLGLLLAFFTTALMAQGPMFFNGDKVLNLGIGFGTSLYSGGLYNSSVPPISASYEVGIKDDVLDIGSIGVGGYIGYVAYKWEYDYGFGSYGYKYSDFVIGARGTFHYPLLENFDTYTGVMLGFDIVSSKEFGDSQYSVNYSASSSHVVGSWYIGGRYYFSDRFAGMLELGYGISYINLGVAFKM
ncbi:MAG TPA: hypothetical protein VE870_04640 [Bacteroidales bacterium]|nr:hypothetical protein [Bacteroidales bacterium]